MPILKFKPTTPSRRFLIQIDKKELSKKGPLKKLTNRSKKKAGRNNMGRITVFHRGGGNSKFYRIIDFKRSLQNVPAKVIALEYDPNRSAFIALIQYSNGILSYILAPKYLKVGSFIESSGTSEISVGNCLPLKKIPVGTDIHNIELSPGKGGQLVRAAGTYARIIKKLPLKGLVVLKLNSKSRKNYIVLSGDCLATIGIVSNSEHDNISLGKAGYSRWLGRRPVVRGVAMNPVDHPHGGGEGKTSGAKVSKTPWGWPTKGYKTTQFKKNITF